MVSPPVDPVLPSVPSMDPVPMEVSPTDVVATAGPQNPLATSQVTAGASQHAASLPHQNDGELVGTHSEMHA
jgi:hypothetical protein